MEGVSKCALLLLLPMVPAAMEAAWPCERDPEALASPEVVVPHRIGPSSPSGSHGS